MEHYRTHVTKKGPGRCRAKSAATCPVKLDNHDAPHFSNPEEAQTFYENYMEEHSVQNRVKLKKKVRKVAAVFGVTAAMASLTACNGTTSVSIPHSIPTSITQEAHKAQQQTQQIQQQIQQTSSGNSSNSNQSGNTYTITRAQWNQAMTQLNKLPQRSRKNATVSGYKRSLFGKAWADVDKNGCDTRDDILKRDMTNVQMKGSSTCTVYKGTLHDPYTGKTINWQRTDKSTGTGDSTTVQIDHVDPLGDAWNAGANKWTAAKRLKFANDPKNLLAVDGPTNEAKSDKTANKFLPGNNFACVYVTKQINIKTQYGLSTTSDEHSTMLKVLKSECTIVG